jgi:hypothetical protein
MAAMALGAVASVPRFIAAQSVSDRVSVDLASGARVRVTAPAAGRIVGTLLSATGDSIRVELANGSSVAFPVDGLSRLELSTGVQRRGWKGAGIGLLAGAGIGGVIGLATYRRTQCDEPLLETFVCSFVDQTSRQVTVIADAAMVGTVGAIVGALIGHVGRESWVRVPLLREGVRIGLATSMRTSRGAIEVAVTLPRRDFVRQRGVSDSALARSCRLRARSSHTRYPITSAFTTSVATRTGVSLLYTAAISKGSSDPVAMIVRYSAHFFPCHSPTPSARNTLAYANAPAPSAAK